MSTKAAIGVSLVIFTVTILAYAHMSTGRPLLVRVHDTATVTVVKRTIDTVLVQAKDARDTSVYIRCPGERQRHVHYSGPLTWYRDLETDGQRIVVHTVHTDSTVVYAMPGNAKCVIGREPINP